MVVSGAGVPRVLVEPAPVLSLRKTRSFQINLLPSLFRDPSDPAVSPAWTETQPSSGLPGARAWRSSPENTA